MTSSAFPSDNRYFQYRVIIEAEDNTACSGKPCLPEVTSIEVGPTGRYYGGSPVVSSKTPISYTDLESMTFSEGGSCSITYQLSPNGSTYYYWSGSAWIAATGENISESASGSDIKTNITSFKSTVGIGSLYFKAFMTSNTSQSCTLDEISLTKP